MTAATRSILVVNAGSSSIKAAVFDAHLNQVARAEALEIGGAAHVVLPTGTVLNALADHAAALGAILEGLATQNAPLEAMTCAAHRVVHGGTALTRAHRITPDVRAGIEALSPLAPLHNPVNLAAIDALTALAPDLPQFASFDTAFHATNPAVATRYAIPQVLHDKGIRRYGFHGLSYASMVARLSPLPRRLLACHLGNGASLCAVFDGRSVATTMGFSPLSGLTMGTRAGDIDANAVLRLVEEIGHDATHRVLNRESGLRALGGTSDMRALDGSAAVEHFRYWAVRHAGSMIAAMGGLDAMAFTGGIGENAEGLRAEIVAGLAWAGRVPVHVVAAQEEHQIAREALALMETEVRTRT